MATEICLYAPNSELPKDFIVSLMVLLMAQLQESRPLLSRSYCQSKLMALSLRHLDPSVPLVDKLHMMTALHSRQPSWSRLFQQHVVYYSAEDQVLLHRLFVATFSTKYRRRCRRGSGSSGSTQRFQMTKTRQKLNLKTREIDWSYIWLQHFDTF